MADKDEAPQGVTAAQEPAPAPATGCWLKPPSNQTQAEKAPKSTSAKVKCVVVSRRSPRLEHH